MRKVMILVVMFVISFSAMAKAEEIIVEGYQAGEYAVKGVVKERLDSIVNQLAGKQVRITVAGSADTVGKSTVNDELAAKRAENARAYLAGKLPMAEVKAPWSEGDSANARLVKVVYSIITLPKSVPASKKIDDLVKSPVVAPKIDVLSYCLWIAIAILLLLAVFQFVGEINRRRTEKEKKIKAKAEEEAKAKAEEEAKAKAEEEAKANAEAILEEKWVDAENEQGNYEVRVIKKGDDKWYTPFMTLKDDSKSLFRADFQSAKKAVRGCAENLRYAGQFKKLLAAGKDVKKK